MYTTMHSYMTCTSAYVHYIMYMKMKCIIMRRVSSSSDVVSHDVDALQVGRHGELGGGGAQ